jgi:NhaA family Na+:H+ antiporter
LAQRWPYGCILLLIGLEIKREIISGELSEMKKAAMPIVGAIGGLVVPVLLYLAINWNGEEAYGWGVPMATDIAFTLGLMALLGSRVPGSLDDLILSRLNQNGPQPLL